MKIQASKTRFLIILRLSLIPIFTLPTKGYAMNDEETYALASGTKGAQRLTIQNETLKNDTEKHLSAVAPSSLIKKGI